MGGAVVPLAFFYPTEAPEQIQQVGPYEIKAALDAPPAGSDLRLVVISHGQGGSPWSHRDLARGLAQRGWVAALVEHPGDNRSDGSLTGTAANLAGRPRHLSLVIDAAFAHPVIGPRLGRGTVGVVGHSIGGYSAPALAGGRPWTGPYDSPRGRPAPVDVKADDRVGALVLLAPATPWFLREGSLQEVRVPVLMWTGDTDVVTPAWHAEIVLGGTGAAVEHRVEAGAGHFSFQSVFPPALTCPEFAPSQDPEGFNRPAFQERLLEGVDAFLRRAL